MPKDADTLELLAFLDKSDFITLFQEQVQPQLKFLNMTSDLLTMSLKDKSAIHFHLYEEHSTGIKENTLDIIKGNAVKENN